MRFFRKKNLELPFKASEDLESRKRNSQVSRPEFKSSRELKRDLSFNDLNNLVYTVPWNMNGLCVPRYSRQRVAEKQTKQKYKVKVAYCDVENLDHQN